MNIVSCTKLTPEQATQLDFSIWEDCDECLLEELQNYKQGYVDSGEVTTKETNEYRIAYEEMQDDEVRFWNGIMLTRTDMLNKATNEMQRCARKPYLLPDLEEYIDNNDIFIMETSDLCKFLVTDIGDALIITHLYGDKTQLPSYEAILARIRMYFG